MTLSTYFNKTTTFVLIFSFASCISWGQINKEVEVGTYVSSSGQNPFWLRTNQYGIVPLESQFITVRGQISKDYDSTTNKKINYGYGIAGVVNIGKINQFILPEFYLKTKWRAFEFYAGRRKEIIGLVDTTLTSGSYSWSGNALPLPKLQISIPHYTSILGKGLLSIKGSYAHGWFGKEFYLKDVYLHQKTFYAQLGKPTWKIKFYGGFTHQVTWGGELNTENITVLKSVRNNQFPQAFKDYVYLVSGVSLNTSKRQTVIDTSKYTSYDFTNRVGNHFGTIDVGFTVSTQNYDVIVYRQSVFDDGSLFFLANIEDGLTGIGIKTKKKSSSRLSIAALNIEYFNSQDQGGELDWSQTNPHIRGQDNYFNHGQFLDGWGYNGEMIGSPFVPAETKVLPTLPRLINKTTANKPVTYFTNNNRVKALAIATEVMYKQSVIRLRMSFSENLGTYTTPFAEKIHQNSYALTYVTPLPKKRLLVTAQMGIDNNGIYPTSVGGTLSAKKLFE